MGSKIPCALVVVSISIVYIFKKLFYLNFDQLKRLDESFSKEGLPTFSDEIINITEINDDIRNIDNQFDYLSQEQTHSNELSDMIDENIIDQLQREFLPGSSFTSFDEFKWIRFEQQMLLYL